MDWLPSLDLSDLGDYKEKVWKALPDAKLNR